MRLYLKIKSGPEKGKEFELIAGQLVGRGGNGIIINDLKISGQHARIELDPSGKLTLIDLGSANGLRIQGKKLAQVPLTPGLLIKIGNTDCEVRGELPLPVDNDEPTLAPLKVEPPKDWPEYLSDFSVSAIEKIQSHPLKLKPFKPLLVLTVAQGIQAGTEWILGFGPREVGAASLDIPLFDEAAPPIAFHIEPKGVSAYFQTQFPQKVRLNGRTTSAEVLKAGDIITVAETTIKVTYKE